MSAYRGSLPKLDNEPVPDFRVRSEPANRGEAFLGALLVGSLIALYGPIILCWFVGDHLGPLLLASPIVGLVAGIVAAVRHR